MLIKFNTPVVLLKILFFSYLITLRGTKGSCWKLIYTVFLLRVFMFQSLLTYIMRNKFKSQNVKVRIIISKGVKLGSSREKFRIIIVCGP